MLLLGRNTAQWTGLLTAISGALVTSIPLFFPTNIGSVPTSSAVAFVGIATGFLGVFIMFLANENLTPVNDPRLPLGSTVNAGLPNEGTIVPVGSGITNVQKGTQVVEAPAVVVEQSSVDVVR